MKPKFPATPALRVSRFRQLLRLPAWWALLPVVIVLAAIGWATSYAIEEVVHEHAAGGIQAILNGNASALELWLEARRTEAERWAADPATKKAILALCKSGGGAELPAVQELHERISPHAGRGGFIDYKVIDRQGIVSADLHGEAFGHATRLAETPAVQAALAGASGISLPFRYAPEEESLASLKTAIAAAAPVPAEAGEIKAALVLLYDAADEFARILAIGRFGKSAETYLFDRSGLMLSESRHTEEMRRAGVLPEAASGGTAHALSLRDPGGNLLEGHRPTADAVSQPLTLAVREAIAGRDGFHVAGYRDYRGVEVMGAWKWLPAYGFGIVTEIDYREAYRAVALLRCVIMVVFGLLIAGMVAFLLATNLIAALRMRVQEVRQLGQYTLEELIGEGGMGAVYRARHALLRRPTAVKLLRPEVASEETIARFEREVQLTSRLSHPNTIAIYDFGRTPDRVFYYAMEYLPGVTLEDLVCAEGAQPEARVIHILRQACGSLLEAHRAGLIHRDIKPANIMLCERGGQHDVVKVLDFGLVRESLRQGNGIHVTAENTITGTPLYMAPEAIRDPNSIDARSDLYALGAVGYYLLAGRHVFEGMSAMDVFGQHLAAEPQPPSRRRGAEISRELEELILACLAKNPAERPSDACAMLGVLDRSAAAHPWTRSEAERRWKSIVETPAGKRRCTEHAAATPSAARLTIEIAPRTVNAT
ncbi:MAG: serine/threonine protein kinase [Planctomycetes bacterium]|nr:serine/threonine protein kinase [Planctomycetota bacterium]